MEHLKYESEGWIYRPREEGKIVEIQVAYTLGGPNFFGGTTPRGVYVSVTPVTLESRPGGGAVRSYTLLGARRESGVRIHVLDLAKRNQKQLDRIAYIVDASAPKIAALWLENDIDSATGLLRKTLEPVVSRAA